VAGESDRTRAIVVLVAGGAEIEVARVVSPRPGLAVVDALARLQLAARRRGGVIRLHRTAPDLVALLDLVGLLELVAD
jgi:hypothetical protein